MAKKYILLEVDSGGGGGGGDEDIGGTIPFIAGLVIIYLIYSSLFGDYGESDFNTVKYQIRAREGAEDLVLEWQGRNWRPRGYTDEIQILSNEPSFKVNIFRRKDPYQVKYMGNGIFEVTVETNTLLKNKKGRTVTVNEGFIVQIQTNKSHGFLYRVFNGDQWRIIAAQQYYMEPTLSQVNVMIQ